MMYQAIPLKYMFYTFMVLLFLLYGGDKVKIRKVLNNNVVIACDRDSQEFIAMGKGIAFGRKTGDCISKSLAEKIFVLSDDDVRNRFHEMLRSIEPESIELAERIISYAVSEYGFELNDIIHITLADHINGLTERLKQNMQLTNQLSAEIRNTYRNEFKTGLYSLGLIEQYTGNVPIEDEAAFIAMHFVNAELKSQTQDNHKMAVFTDDIIRFTEKFLGINFNTDSVLYYQFLSHLKFLAQRVFSDEPFSGSNFLYEFLSPKFPKLSECAEKISDIIKLKYNKVISDEEKAYLIIYFEKFTR